MDDAQDVVALQHRVHDDPDGVDVVYLIHVPALHVHLAVDAVDALDPAVDLGVDVFVIQAALDAGDDALQKGFPLLLAHVQLLFDIGVGDGVQVLDGDVLQFLLHPPDAQPVGQGGVDLHRLQRLHPALFVGEGSKGAGVVQPVGQLDDDDPDILGHGQQHLADVLRLLPLPGGKGDAPQLGDPVHQEGDLLAELLFDLVQGDVGVLHHVVEEGGNDGIGVHPQFHQDDGGADGVDDIGLPGAAQRPLMGALRQLVGLFDPLHIILLIGLFDPFRQLPKKLVHSFTNFYCKIR